MKKNSSSQSAAARILTGLILAVAGCLAVNGTLPVSFGAEASAEVSKKTLTFTERVAFQRAIEEVYWRHRIWPRENPGPKPSLDNVMPQKQIETKVEDYLRKSQALADYWGQPLRAEQLQAEMDRMAKHTKQPEVLRELFEALGNDFFVIAECLARPALSERLLTNWYAFDERFHGGVKKHAEAELRTYPTVKLMKQVSGQYGEVELIRSESSEPLENRDNAKGSTKLTSREWDETVEKLALVFNKQDRASGSDSEARRQIAAGSPSAAESTTAEASKIIPIGKLGPLQEDETHFFVTAIMEKTADRLKLATVTWSKESLESWITNAESEVRESMVPPGAAYTLPSIDGAGGCADDSWMATAIQGESRHRHTVLWTGTEMIVWGGEVSLDVFSNTGERYNPSTDSWVATSTVNAPTARADLTAVWTGTEMIVWGGDTPGVWFNTGGRYSPTADTWTPTSTANAPLARDSHTVVWTGSEMIVWGGYFYNGSDQYLNTGGRYNPNTDVWIATNLINAPNGRNYHTAIWTGSEMVVWGGAIANSQWVNTGGRYNVATDSWAATSTVNAPSARGAHTTVWTGSEMMVWGGFTFSSETNTGGRYNPSTDGWTATSITNAPTRRYVHTTVWTGSEAIVWGGYGCLDPLCLNRGDLNTGDRYNPNTDSWTATNLANAPTARASQTAVWTGSEMIVWGGDGQDPYLNTGGRYCVQPSTPIVQSAASQKVHGNAGSFAVDLPLSGTPGIECRRGGATSDYTIVLTFLANVSVNGSPQAAVTSGTGTIGSGGVSNGGMVITSGNVVTIPLTNVANAQSINVTLNNVNGSTNVTIPMSVLIGDVNGNRAVNASDVALTKSRSGQPVAAATFRSDVNANGSINAADVALVKSLAGTGLP